MMAHPETASLPELRTMRDELRSKESYLFDKFTRAAASRSGSILRAMCSVSAERHSIEKEIMKRRIEHEEKTRC